jgi:hypothetical protein
MCKKLSGKIPHLKTSFLFDLPLKGTGNQEKLNMVTNIADDAGFDKK